ncbi:Holliday junction branch migration protein RuvA [Rhodospirillaceae bacterium SYSU D60014]|uniref:Holliday junction branch migration protein RuvA n=1 Tax=Virgifigura deserti TaxID=2268457 RepID=UPI000E662AB1
MIAKLTGILDSTATDSLVIDVGGVGYLVFCSGRTLGCQGSTGASVTLLIETHVREDYIHLYGFADAAERDCFRLLTTVQGVGSRMALALLGVLSPDELMQAIVAKDKTSLTRASGVGPKLAGRIIAELADKVTGMALEPAVAAAISTSAGAAGPIADAVSALVNLGYRRAEAFGAVAQAAQQLGPNAGIDALIRAGLKELSAKVHQ